MQTRRDMIFSDMKFDDDFGDAISKEARTPEEIIQN